MYFFFFSSRRRHTRFDCDWSSDVCSSDLLSKRGASFTSRGISSALGTLAYIARNEEKKDSVRNFLIGYVNDKRERVQLAAISALGTLGDPQALAVVEKFTAGSKETPQRRVAEKAAETLRADRKPV